MPIGLEVYNPSTGEAIASFTARFGNFIHFFDTNGAINGSVVIPKSAGKTLILLPFSTTGSSGLVNRGCPTLSISGSTVSWSYNTSIPANFRHHRVYVGEY